MRRSSKQRSADKDSAPLYREALSVRYDYLADRRPRGVDVLARVSAAVDDKQAAPLLALHLLDPATAVLHYGQGLFEGRLFGRLRLGRFRLFPWSRIHASVPARIRAF